MPSKGCWRGCARYCAGRRTCRRKPCGWPAVVDLGNREASVAGQPLDLPRRELLVLEALLRRMGRTVTRSSLEDAVYSFDDEIQSNALDTHVSRLRRKLAEAEAKWRSMASAASAIC